MVKKSALLLCSLGLLGTVGCAGRSKPLSSAMFNPSPASMADVPLQPRPPLVVPGDPQNPSVGEIPRKATVLPSPDAPSPLLDVKPIAALGSSPPTTAASESITEAVPATSDVPPNHVQLTPDPPPVRQGTYMTLGGVIAVVNDKPIYAEQILNPIDRELAVKAHDLDEQAYRRFAGQEINKQLEEQIQNEIFFASAYHSLTADDRKMAKMVMVQIRQEKITAAGGSLELARQKSLEAGEDFDAAMDREYRGFVAQLYSHRMIEPRVHITGDDMRTFYRQQAGKLFTDKDRMQFRVIEIDPEKAGGLTAATDKIKSLRERAVHGEDFAALATANTDDKFLKPTGGCPTDPGQWMERDTYPNEAVETALWQIEPGQVTAVLTSKKCLYIAKLEAKHLGSTKPFDDARVQDEIYARLRQLQMAKLRDASSDQLPIGEMVNPIEGGDKTLLEMAMQKYAQATK